MEQHTLIIIGEVLLVPVLTFLTMVVRGFFAKNERQFKRDHLFITGLGDRVKECETRHAKRDTEIAEIRTELKNRDKEYVKLFQEHATLRAKHEVLEADHADLKRNYDETAKELNTLKENIKRQAEVTSKAIQNI